MSNEAFEKWYQSQWLYEVDFTKKSKVDEYYSAEVNRTYKAWQAGKAGSEREIAELYGLAKQQANDYLKAHAELQAHINDLRETLEWIDRDYGTIGIHSIVTSSLSTTPAQSLQEHDNEVIEKCAKVCEDYMFASIEATKDCSNRIRELKGNI